MLGIALDRGGEVALRRQIYMALKERMMDGRLPEGEALPSTREMARQLAVSRNTVCEAYDMLIAEGFARSQTGAATRVAPGLCLRRTEDPPLSSTHDEVLTWVEADFRTGQPNLRHFPRFAFAQALAGAARELSTEQMGYTGPHGLYELRAEISAWLYRSRGISAHPEDICICAGATQGLHVVSDLLYTPGAKILVEDPCHTGMLQTFLERGYEAIPAAVDRHGIRTELLARQELSAIYVTPSHQFPLGGILPAGRRTALLRVAQECGCFVIEDDYDSEFRFGGEPVAPLYTMDTQRVIYVGTFSKTLFPALRIGFVILPRTLRERWGALRTHTDVQNPPWEQAALAELLRTRRFDRHVHGMRRVYGLRREALLKSLSAAFGDGFEPWGDAAGLHLCVAFRGRRFDDAFAQRCLARGMRVVPVEYHCIRKGAHEDKLLLGYGHLEPEEIEKGIRLLKDIMEEQA